MPPAALPPGPAVPAQARHLPPRRQTRWACTHDHDACRWHRHWCGHVHACIHATDCIRRVHRERAVQQRGLADAQAGGLWARAQPEGGARRHARGHARCAPGPREQGCSQPQRGVAIACMHAMRRRMHAHTCSGSACLQNSPLATHHTHLPDYMAPEVLRCPLKRSPDENKTRSDFAYSEAVDAWAAGVLAYELLVGQ